MNWHVLKESVLISLILSAFVIWFYYIIMFFYRMVKGDKAQPGRELVSSGVFTGLVVLTAALLYRKSSRHLALFIPTLVIFFFIVFTYYMIMIRKKKEPPQ
jgi:hypothetical protein